MTRARNVANRGWQAARRNILINGGMQVWQRGTSGSIPVATFTYTADRWVCDAAGAAVTWLIAPHPVATGINAALVITGAAGNTQVGVAQRVEALNAYRAVGKKVTVSGWVFSAAARVLTLSIAAPDVADVWPAAAPVSSGTINVPATGWSRFSFTFPDTMPATVARGMQLMRRFMPGVGAGAQIGFTDVQLEIGEEATDFEWRSQAEELALCQRYFEVGEYRFGSAGVDASGQSQGYIYYKQTKRKLATVTRIDGTLTNSQASLLQSSTPSGCQLAASALAVGLSQIIIGSYQADAEL
jgi:hypothetical protein